MKSSKIKLVEVAAAVLQRPDGSFLLAQRPTGKIWAGYWEFPGGKIEAGEAPYHALIRELREELGIEVETAYPWITRVFTYPHATVRLNFFRVMAWRGELHPHEGQKFAWQRFPDVYATQETSVSLFPQKHEPSLIKSLDFRLMKLLVKQLAIWLTQQKTLRKPLVIAIRLGCQTALHSHSAKSPKYGDISRWLTPAKSLVMLRRFFNKGVAKPHNTLSSVI